MKSKNATLTGLYAITDPELLPGKQLFTGVESALAGGARVIQYRDKQATDLERLRNALSLRSLTRQFGASFLINDDLDLCLRADADGVHLGKADGDIAYARQRLGSDRLLGVTCHSDLNYARHSVALGVDYCAFGRMFSSVTKPHAPHCPLEVLREAVKLPCSTIAIGGITLANAPTLVAAKVDMIAVIHGLFGQDDIESVARSFSALFS